jgi:hypothetical protein
MIKPRYWFRSIHESRQELRSQPENIEYLNMWTGETYIHVGGTAYWDQARWGGLNIDSLNRAGITHYRLVEV